MLHSLRSQILQSTACYYFARLAGRGGLHALGLILICACRQQGKPKALVLSASAKIRRSKNAKKQSAGVFFFLAPLLRSQDRLAEKRIYFPLHPVRFYCS